MRVPFVPRIGGILTADIAVPEHERELRFYSCVLGTGERPLWRGDLMNDRGMPIIGLGARTAEHEALPMQWMPHIQVADVAESVARASGLGGRVLLHGRDASGRSQWGVLLDPNGAAFGVVPVVSADEFAALGGPASHDPAFPVGCIDWLELTVPDARAAREFYQHVVGWDSESHGVEEAGGRSSGFRMFGGDGHAAAGLLQASGANSALPPVWMIHLPVGDFAESLRRVEQQGGGVIRQTGPAGAARRTAVIRDPVGAHLALVSR